VEHQKTENQDDRPRSSQVKAGSRYCRQDELGMMGTWRDVYASLEQVAPARKTEIILRLIEAHPQGNLELPKRDGVRANLSKVDLSDNTIWRRDDLKINLQQANLQEANLAGVKLQHADLSGANFQHADLTGADLRNADLRYTDLRNADLAGADLRNARLFGADLQNAGLRSTSLQNASLRSADLQNADLRHADLQDTDLRHADLRSADLLGANLRNASLRSANLQGAGLERANLQNAALRHADVRYASLKEANLQKTDLQHAHLQGAYLSGVWLDHTRLRRDNFGGETGQEAIGEELEAKNKEHQARERARKYQESRLVYLSLKQHFEGLGDYTAASWAYRKERRMEKLEAREKMKAAFTARNWRGVVSNGPKYLSDILVEIVSDYGEGIWRVLFWILAFIFMIGPLLYGLLGVFDWTPASEVVYASFSYRWQQYVYAYYQFLLYSIDTFSTGNYAELTPNNASARLVSSCLTMIGIFLVGLLGFVAGRRIRRS
jgi:uncharacterized protein YjbI with pentapeptide repeats